MSEKLRNSDNTINETITVMKMLATVFVIYIHSANLFGYSNNAIPVYLFPVKALFQCAVPAFMSISGYLLFLKPIRFLGNLKKKTFRLVIPFLFWSLFWIVFELIGFLIFPNKFSNVLNWSPLDFLLNLVGIPFYRSPLYTPLWYVRDLFLLVLISPLFENIIRKFPYIIFFIAIILWFTPFNLHLREAICFFMIGSSLSCIKVLVKFSEKFDIRFGLILLVLGIITSLISTWIMSRISTLIFLVFFLVLAHALSKHELIIKYCNKNIMYSFFIYVTHGKLLSIIQILYSNKFQSMSLTLIGYIVIPFIVFIFCLGSAFFIQRLLPRFFAFCNGEKTRQVKT